MQDQWCDNFRSLFLLKLFVWQLGGLEHHNSTIGSVEYQVYNTLLNIHQRDCEVRVSKDSVFVSISASNSSQILIVTNRFISSQYDCLCTSEWPHFLSQSPPISSGLLCSVSFPSIHWHVCKRNGYNIQRLSGHSAASTLHWSFAKFGGKQSLV
jgi:hypothetical protein